VVSTPARKNDVESIRRAALLRQQGRIRKCVRAAGTVDGASRSRIQRSGWVCAAGTSYRAELSAYKEQDTRVEEISWATTKRQGLPFDTFGTSLERQTIERGGLVDIANLIATYDWTFVYKHTIHSRLSSEWGQRLTYC